MRSLSSLLLAPLLFLGVALCSSPVGAQGFGEGDLLVAVGSNLAGTVGSPDTVFEFTPEGHLVGSLKVDKPQGCDDAARNIAVDGSGRLLAFNGTFSPYLSLYDPATAAWTHRTYDGWSTVNNVTYGGVAAYKNFAFVTDEFTAGNGSPSGIIRFNTDDQTAQRFASGGDFINLCMGYDGLLYAVAYGDGFGTPIYVYDPDSLALLRSFHLPLDSFNEEYRSIAVNKHGDIFAVGLAGSIAHCDPNGALLNSVYSGATYAVSLALSEDGQIAVTRTDGYVTVTDESLQAVHTFQAYSSSNSIAWSMFVTFVPHHTHFDFNGDHHPDLLWQNSGNGAIACWKMNGSQRLGTVTVASSIPLDWKLVGSGDYTRDGKPDLLFQNDKTGDVICWKMNGTTFGNASLLLATGIPKEWKVVGTPDLNGDGKPDILWHNQVSGDVAYWLMNGIQPLSHGTIYKGVDTNWKLVANADLDGDGKPDLVWQNQATGKLSYWLMNGIAVRSFGKLAENIAAELRVVGAYDIDGDGKPDLLWQNQTTGAVTYWRLDGLTYLSSGTITTSVAATWKVAGMR